MRLSLYLSKLVIALVVTFVAAVFLLVPTAASAAPPAACTAGASPVTNSPWTVCRADINSAWVSANNSGQFHALAICKSLGYKAVTANGGTCGSVCGYCQTSGTTSCSSPGNEQYGGGGVVGEDIAGGPLLASTVQWKCSEYVGVTTTVEAKASAGGSVSPAGSQSVADGESVSYTLAPQPGYFLSAVTDTCGASGAPVGVLSGSTYDVQPKGPPNASCEVSATFSVFALNVQPSYAETYGTTLDIPLVSNGGKAPVTYAVTGGALPSGVSLMGDDVAGYRLAGALSKPGSYEFSITATDADGALSAPALIAVTVSPAPLKITANNVTLTEGEQIPVLSGSYSGFVLGDTSASLATQASFSTTATAASPPGTYPITVQGGQSDNYALSYVAGTLNILPAELAITTTDLGSMQAGKAFSLALSVSGGVPPYTWSATDADKPLPDGLRLSAEGVLSGTPTHAGDYVSRITVTDSSLAPVEFALLTTPAQTKAASVEVSQVFSGTVAAAQAMVPTPVPTVGGWALALIVATIHSWSILNLTTIQAV